MRTLNTSLLHLLRFFEEKIISFLLLSLRVRACLDRHGKGIVSTTKWLTENKRDGHRGSRTLVVPTIVESVRAVS